MGLSQKELAKIADVCVSTIHGWEHNTYTPTARNAELIIHWLEETHEITGAPPTTLGYLIRKKRKKEGRSLADLADHFGVSSASVSHWEAGDRNPSRSNKEAILAWLKENEVAETQGNGETEGLASEDEDRHDDGSELLVTKAGIGERIRRKRKEWGMTQYDLSEYLGVSVPTIAQWEKDKTIPSYANYKMLCDWLAMDITSRIHRSD